MPKSRHRSKAYHRDIEIMEGRKPRPRIPARLFWWWMVWDGSPEDCVEYLETNPNGPLRAEALDRLDRICWAEATKENTVASCDGYNDRFNGLTHEAEAERRVRELQHDDRPFATAAKAGTEEAWDDLPEPGPLWYWTPTVTAGMRKRPVTPGDSFTLLPTPPNADLARLVAYFVFIMPEEAINALQIVEAAGLDLRGYAIWNDCEEVFWSLVSRDSYGWRYLVDIDPEGVSRTWESLNAEVAKNLGPVEAQVLPILKATPVEVEIIAPPQSRCAAWLAWYLREAGDEVDCGVDRDLDDEMDEEASREPWGTWVGFDGKVAEQGWAIVNLVQHAFALRSVEIDSVGVAMQGGSLHVDVRPMGTNDEEKEREAIDEIPRVLRAMWRG